MSASKLLEQLKHLNTGERLAVIEAASRLIRRDLQASSPAVAERQEGRLRQAAAALVDLYAPGSDLTEWAALDAEDFLDDSTQK